MPDAVPNIFEPEHYRAQNPDLAGLSDAQAAEHHAAFGRDEGRIASPLALREALLALARQAGTALEIGPFCSPVLRGDTVR